MTNLGVGLIEHMMHDEDENNVPTLDTNSITIIGEHGYLTGDRLKLMSGIARGNSVSVAGRLDETLVISAMKTLTVAVSDGLIREFKKMDFATDCTLPKQHGPQKKGKRGKVKKW